MEGRFRLPTGLSAACWYKPVADSRGGTLKLPSALYLPLRESDEGTLTFANSDEHRVEISFVSDVGDAVFTVCDTD